MGEYPRGLTPRLTEHEHGVTVYLDDGRSVSVTMDPPWDTVPALPKVVVTNPEKTLQYTIMLPGFPENCRDGYYDYEVGAYYQGVPGDE